MSAISKILVSAVFLSSGFAFSAPMNCARFGGQTKSVMTSRDPSTAKVIVFCDFDREMVALDTLVMEKSKRLKTDAVNAFLSKEERKVVVLPDGTTQMGSYSYCLQVNGTYMRVYNEDGSEGGICELKDGSKISGWTMYRGAGRARTKKLEKVILKIRR